MQALEQLFGGLKPSSQEAGFLLVSDRAMLDKAVLVPYEWRQLNLRYFGLKKKSR